MRPKTVDEQDDPNSPVLKGVRARVAISHFKRCVLGDLHIGSRPQAKALFETLEELTFKLAPKRLTADPQFEPIEWLGLDLSPRAWEGWYSKNAHVPQPGKLRGLDQAASKLISWRRPVDGLGLQLPMDFYSSLAHAGLLQTMLAPTDAKGRGADLLRSRASRYRPRSAWHLHLDAMELRAFCDDFRGFFWSDIVQVAAGRVLEILHRLWRPVDGQIYGLFSSDTRLRWDAASDDERVQIRSAFAQLKPDQFESSMVAGASPSWEVTGTTPDIPSVHVHRLLFAIGADADFLQGDRLTAWAMDLATAGMAAHALAWTDRYRQLGRKVTGEQMILAAIDALLLSTAGNSEDQHLVEIERELRAAMGCLHGDWSHAEVLSLHRARAAYHAEILELGLALEEIQALSRRAQERHALVYLGDSPPLKEGTSRQQQVRQGRLWDDLAEAAYRRQGVGNQVHFSDLPNGTPDQDRA